MKVMFVCTGNICRSAMAKAMLEKRLQELRKSDTQVYSCGIYAENGDGATYNSIEALEEYAINLKAHRATNILNSNIQEMDLVLCMTESHKHSVLELYPDLKGKVYTLKGYVGFQEKEKDNNIMDPWGYDISVYKHCAEEISICIEMLLQKLYHLY